MQTQDFCSHNIGVHASGRVNTFNTPANLDVPFESQTGLGKKHSPKEAKHLLDICEQAFDKSLRNIGSSIVASIKEELQQSIAGFQRELTNSRHEMLNVSSSTRTVLDDLQKQTADATDVLHLLRLEGKQTQQAFMQCISHVEDDIHGIRQSQEHAGSEISRMVRDQVHDEIGSQAESQQKEIMQMQVSLNSYTTQTMEEIRRVHQGSMGFMSECFERHLVPLAVDKHFVQVSSQIERTQEVVNGIGLTLTTMAQDHSGKLMHYMSQMADDLRTLQDTQEQTGQGLVQQVQKTQQGYNEALALSDTKLTEIVHTMQELRKMHRDSAGNINEALSRQLEDRIGGGDQPIHLTIMQVLGQVGQSQRLVQEDFTDLIREIGKVQQALNVDFVQVLGDLQHSFEAQATMITDEVKKNESASFQECADRTPRW
jgi:hypothetical protein